MALVSGQDLSYLLNLVAIVPPMRMMNGHFDAYALRASVICYAHLCIYRQVSLLLSQALVS